MINLLPPEEKKELLSEQKRKIIIVLWVLVLFFLICLILLLFSIKIYLQTQVLSQKILLQRTQGETEQSEIRNLQEKINSINQTLTKLNSLYQQKIYFSEILKRIPKILPQEIYLTTFSAIKKEAGIKVSLSGFSPTREILFGLRENLKKEADFKKVSFPPANWVEPVNIDFQAAFNIR